MPVFNRWIDREAHRALARIQATASLSRQQTLRRVAALLIEMIRYDPDHQGTPSPGDPADRVVILGPLCAWCNVRPADCTVELRGFFPNVHWVDSGRPAPNRRGKGGAAGPGHRSSSRFLK
jgi:hypothetical protein